MLRRTTSHFLALTLFVATLHAEPPKTADPLPDGTAAAQRQIGTFRTPPGLRVELFAAEPQLGNPVAIALDERNRVFVAEEYRFNRGTEENRTRPFLLDDDLQIGTVEQRLSMFEKYLDKFPGGWNWFRDYTDQVRLLEDRDGNGRADHATVFDNGFHEPADGLLAGVLARDGEVWVTCIPKLWRLRDRDGDGKADEREVLLDGFGPNAGFLGHDLHGLVWGPDGKLYFSIGDRGFHVRTKEGTLASLARRGAVFRCEPDGTDFEVLHIGLRNPQEIAFDDYGNLFAADNNCDKGDYSRLVYVVDGGDSGWNMAYQTIPAPYLTGPWHAEKMWLADGEPEAAGVQPAWVLPAVGKLGAGPSGFSYYPGVGLPDRYQGHFFLCNFTGNGGLESFAVKTKGASFEIVDAHDFLKPIMATDAEFGYDGQLYVSDFVGLEWNGGSKGGRVYRVFDPQRRDTEVVTHMKRLVAEGFSQRENDELATLLRHPDQRVRQRAQFELARRGESGVGVFRTLLSQRDQPLVRLHALWGLGQMLRRHPHVVDDLRSLLSDSDVEVRAQAAKTLGDRRVAAVAAQLLPLLKDSAPRVQFFAAQSLGRLRHLPAVEPLFALIRANQDRDRYLRHAAVVALATIDARDTVLAKSADPDASVRMAVALILRRWADPRIARLLRDSEVAIATEAARAIHDLSLGGEALTELANAAQRLPLSAEPWPEALTRRAINANFRLAKQEHVERLALIAASEKLALPVRRDALEALGTLLTPAPRDRVTGFWSPQPPADGRMVRDVLQHHLATLLGTATPMLQADVTQLVARLDLKTDEHTFVQWARDAQRPATARLAALRLLAQRRNPELPALLEAALTDEDATLRAAARELITARDASRGVQLLAGVLRSQNAQLLEQQQAFPTLVVAANSAADQVLTEWAERLASGTVPPALQLDVLEAATARGLPALRMAVEKYRASLPTADPLARHRVALVGGDAARGRDLFVGHRVAQCVRCHKVGGQGGDAGPDLSQVAAKNDREYLLQSLIDPNAKIAPGFGSVTLVLHDGQTAAGIIKEESAAKLVLVQPDGLVRTFSHDQIEERSPPRSLMPAMDRALSPRELRDVVEYLSTLRGTK